MLICLWAWPFCLVIWQVSISRSVEFYVEQLGFQIVSAYEPEGELLHCSLRRDAGEVTLEAGVVTGGEGVVIRFLCDDLDELRKDFLEREAPVDSLTTNAEGNRQVWISDPDGYQLCFEEAYPRKP